MKHSVYSEILASMGWFDTGMGKPEPFYTDIGRTHHVNRVGEHTEFMLQKFDKLEELHRKNSHKYAAKGITHYNPVFL